jgi:hypothetical protein
VVCMFVICHGTGTLLLQIPYPWIEHQSSSFFRTWSSQNLAMNIPHTRTPRTISVNPLPELHLHCIPAPPCPRSKTSKVIAPAEAEECLPCLRGEKVLVLFCSIKKGDCSYATEELGAWQRRRRLRLIPHATLYIYTSFRISTCLFFLKLPASITTVSASERTLEVRENTINMVKVAVEKPDLVHFTHVDVK